MDAALARRRLALFALFFVPGVSLASWVTRTPAIRDLLGASTAEMGLVLFGLSIGSMVGILSSGALVARFGARPVITVGLVGIVISMPTVGLGAAVGSNLLAAFGLFLFGLAMGGGEVAMNVEGAELERRIGRPVLPALHGCFSLGTVVGAVAGIVFTATDFSVVLHLMIVGVLGLVIFVIAIRQLEYGVGKVDRAARSTTAEAVADADAAPVRRAPVWRDRRLLLIGAIVLAMALAEGSANDWLPLLMVDGHDFDPAYGSAVFAVFALAMTVGRFVGGWFIERFGRAHVLRASAVAGVIGLVLVIFVDNQIVAGLAVILWGLGAALGFPLALSAAGDSGPEANRRVALVATVGYVAFLVGPPVLGFLGEEFGLRAAMIVPLVLVAVAIFLAPAVGGRLPRPADEQEPTRTAA
ncbi:MFS transporter [Herbiconiux sp. KACC 21604]|uniref:MFS transporter n=1 Tax=unclassified Herbiconiux TaxID=2618217 RepID=UPI0014924EB3|nr:MFS transporter [Herbiconiux sp. SALV-R1]QJU54230.1 MFS transporter [Herbiconiux sp. SALV-R1]WPO85292.1 MFS transporter [Herbiconiux sp. KACC 21604]